MKYWLAVLPLLSAAALLAAPEFTSDGELKRPANYREWIYLSSGLGTTYGPAGSELTAPAFDNVFVEPEAYRAFLATGKWQEGTMFVLEIRRSEAETKIGKTGRFQTTVIATEAAVKDSKRFPSGWGYFDLGRNATAKVLPPSASCYSCHGTNTAVENTFVQFYPTLLEVAREKGTLKPAFIQSRQ